VRLRREVAFEGDFLRVWRVAGGILLTPPIRDTKMSFAKLDQIGPEAFLKPRRKQTRHAPKRQICT
jgi:virulence-associated protein VagC